MGEKEMDEFQAMPLSSFGEFVIERSLSEDTRTKTTYVLGRFHGKDGRAVVRLEKDHFTVSALPVVLSAATSLETVFHNNIYSKYKARGGGEEVSIFTVDVVYPADEKHIAKYSEQERVLVVESPQLYRSVTRLYIQSIPPSRLQWVYNILEGKAEADRVLFLDSDPQSGFVLLPDQKWDKANVGELYCMAICQSRDVRSLRDLNHSHLGLLRHIRSKSAEVLTGQFGVREDQLRFYVHYQPTYYHFHVHIQHLAVDGGHGMAVGRAHLLDDIIDNLELDGPQPPPSSYYMRRTLHYALGTNDGLLQELSRGKEGGAGLEEKVVEPADIGVGAA